MGRGDLSVDVTIECCHGQDRCIYIYEYERRHIKTGRVQWSNSRLETADYRTVINRRGQDGWWYAGFIPTMQLGAGVITEIDLIFEKEM